MLKEKRFLSFAAKRLLVILFAVLALHTQAQTAPQYLNVLAVNGLNMRSRPDANARIITKVAYGKSIDILEKTAVALQLGWIKDHWYHVRYRGREGYIFGGYLSRLSAPREMADSVPLPELLLRYGKDVLAVDGKIIRSVEPNGMGDTLYHSLQRFAGGAELELEQEGNRSTAILLLDTDVEKTYALLEALLKKAGREKLLEQLRFVKGADGRLGRVSDPNGSIRIRKLSDTRVELRLTAYAY